MDSKKRFKVFQAFRFFAFLMIFLQHTKAYHTFGYVSSAWAVSFFIILSGFLTGFKHNAKYEHIKIKEIKDFVLKRMKKIYVLHIIMLVICIPITGFFAIDSKEVLINWLGKLLINGCLIQSFFNKSGIYFSFNGVSWFLSTIMFLIVLTIPFLYLINKVGKSQNGKVKLLMIVRFFYNS